jgi:hypothetical protein
VVRRRSPSTFDVFTRGHFWRTTSGVGTSLEEENAALLETADTVEEAEVSGVFAADAGADLISCKQPQYIESDI